MMTAVASVLLANNPAKIAKKVAFFRQIQKTLIGLHSVIFAAF